MAELCELESLDEVTPTWGSFGHQKPNGRRTPTSVDPIVPYERRLLDMEDELENAYAEIRKLKGRLEQERTCFRGSEAPQNGTHEIIGESNAIKSVLSQAEQVAATDSIVLISGETGTGKELLARAIHNLSSRRAKAMVTVNCSALPPTLIESELFGREKGAYTGAMARQAGRFEAADGSTIFLDEIGELPLELQAKLLRVLENGTFERLGSSHTTHVNVRVIAATNRDLAKAVHEGTFRKDLYYRLNVFPITVPALRERQEDIPLLAWAFANEYRRTMGKGIECIPSATMQALRKYSWPGNVRELKNMIERAMILSAGTTLHIELPYTQDTEASEGITLKDIEKKHILDILNRTTWRVRGRNGAAAILGLNPSTLESRMARLGIKRKR